MTTAQPAEQPVPLSESQLSEVAGSLPEGAAVLGGVSLSAGKTPDGYGTTTESGNCVLVFCALDEHSIHRAEMCGGGTEYEIVSDTVVGAW